MPCNFFIEGQGLDIQHDIAIFTQCPRRGEGVMSLLVRNKKDCECLLGFASDFAHHHACAPVATSKCKLS